jgi:hypothetical protein
MDFSDGRCRWSCLVSTSLAMDSISDRAFAAFEMRILSLANELGHNILLCIPIRTKC